MDSTDHGRQMGHEGKADRLPACLRQAFQDLRGMPMPRHTVRLEVIGRLREKYMHFRFAAGPAHSGFRVGDQMTRISQPRLDQWEKPQLHCGRIAAWIADDARAPNALPIELRKAVDGLLE